MGIGMARNLMRADHTVTVYNRTRAKAEALGKEGASVANTPAEAAREAEAVFTMLADDAAVSEVVFGPDGIASALPTGSVHLSGSTISVLFARKLAQEHGNRNQGFVSSPVFGRPDAAEAKKLLVILAGDEKLIDRCRPLAEAIGRQTFVLGSQPWHANALKLCGNFMIVSMLEAFGEAFAVMRKAGIEEQHFLSVMAELFGSPVYKNYGTTLVERKFEPAGFALKLGLKDVRQVLELGSEVDAPMPLASLARDQFVSALAHGQEKLDWSSIALVAARAAGLDTKGPA